jgi:hypothetical protein
MHSVTVRLLRMIDVGFHTRSINIPISLNGIEHMYSITTGLHMMVYKTSCLDVLVFSESFESLYIYKYC